MNKKPVDPFNDQQAPKSQAERIIAKFGGARKLARALKRLSPDKHRDPATIFRWTYSKSKGGSAGLVPTAALADVAEAARLEGIFLDPSDFDPRPR